ncbi:MAG TPA: PilC/PilY family type IV pilus protein, partial [Gallionella sp.]|nr:PilC/PilY family type IV pilus protein [Gallionella sp.]
MSNVDLSTHAMPAAKKIITYTIGVLSSACKADYPALLTSMATMGGGKYFPSGSAAEILQAVLRVLNEVQAVNSVFASSSLPVSINTQGTYRNQIFMGMFRPDAGGAPRWNGNLKQYQLGYIAATQTLFLADALGYDAIRAATPINPRPGSCSTPYTATGFLDPCAASFWTCTNSTQSAFLGTPYSSLATCALDPANGFWANQSNGQGLTWDLPDGEVVEKGGASQMLRLANLNSITSRKVYTDCSGANCALSSTPFATSNTAITDALLGTGPITITSIISAATVQAGGVTPGAGAGSVTISITNFSKGSGSTVTATVSAADLALLAIGTQLQIATTQSKYNCNPCTVTSINTAANTFTYTGSNGNQAPPATPYTANVYTNFVTVTKIGHGLGVGQTLTFSSCILYAALNDTVVPVTAIIDANNFKVATTMPLVGILPDLLCRYTPNTATVTTATDHGLYSGAFVTIAGAGGSTTTPYTGYNGAWAVTVTGNTTFTYQYTAPAPLASFSGSATLTSTSTTRNDLINWVRGEDNFGDEASICPPGSTAGTGNCPNPKVVVRPSVHGDVLHSRPVVLDYGDTARGVVAFYGDNGGVFHAVNGNQTGAISGVSAGGELWGFIPSEFFGKLKRLHDNSPALKMTTTPAGIIPTPRSKDYFVDGSIGVYQKLYSDGTTQYAYLYLTMRRGGRIIYALDVSDPVNPKFLWKRSYTDTGFGELGQTWSQPKVALVAGHANPVLIFGAGYDAAAEDAEPPTADTMGRGIFILDALNGSLVWKATYGSLLSCPNGTAACTLPEMKYSIPSDITLMDHDGDGKVDRLYVGDMGGNLWRVDLEPTGGNTPTFWQVEKLAALGCDSGACSAGTTPRKIFYPPELITASSSTPPYDAVFVATGDREHPTYSTASQSACAKTNRAYLLEDPKTGKDGSGLVTLTEANLFDATTNAWDGTLNGYYITFNSCEKAVNAPLVVAGNIYFGTSQAKAAIPNVCSDLGTARGYTLSAPLFVCMTGTCPKTWTSVTYAGGGLPPSPMAGVINVTGAGPQVPFCIGCGGTEGGSPLAAIRPPIVIPTTRTRTYWYLRGK